MKAAPAPSAHPPEEVSGREPSWSYARWTAYLLLAFAAHLGLIYGLGNRRAPEPRPVKNNLTWRMLATRDEVAELRDPTVFAGPHARGFAASTWLRLPTIPYPSFRWSEPPRFLALATESLGAVFLSQRETNAIVPREVSLAPVPTQTVLPPLDPPAAPTQSLLRLSAGLAARKLETTPDPLPLQRPHEGLTNSVVRVLVDAAGRTFSPTILPPGSNSREADQLALKIAGDLKFAPLKNAALTVGTLVFEWQTDPGTNSVAR
jgi:hypothetical protein